MEHGVQEAGSCFVSTLSDVCSGFRVWLDWCISYEAWSAGRGSLTGVLSLCRG
jgi:hypothetical protein